jgi:hypothetical protein
MTARYRQTVVVPMRIVLTAAVIALALAAPASADVLVDAPKSVIRCGGSIRVGVWYRDFPTTGHRDATVEVRSGRGFVVFRRHVQAPARWRFWHYKPQCGRHYRVRYTTFAGVESFRVRVRRP